jgi:hypothetical protein
MIGMPVIEYDMTYVYSCIASAEVEVGDREGGTGGGAGGSPLDRYRTD